MMIESPDSVEAYVARTGIGQTHINTLVLSVLRLRLFDPFEYPMPRAPFRLTINERTIEGKADENAWIEIRVLEVPEQATIAWGIVDEEEEISQGPSYPEASGDPAEQAIEPPPKTAAAVNAATPVKYLYEREIQLAFDTDEEKATLQRIHNLGYNVWQALEDNVRAFQLTYQQSLTGRVGDIKSELWCWHDDCGPKPFPQLESKSKVK